MSGYLYIPATTINKGEGRASGNYFSKEKMEEHFSNPKVIGPGAWFFMHMIAAHSSTPQEQKWAVKMIRQFCESFKCGQCQGHCREYIKSNPPEDSVGKPDGLFQWVVTFRNAVQKRLGAPQYDPSILRDIFHDDEFMVCRGNCGDSHPQESDFLEFETDKNKAIIYRDRFGAQVNERNPSGNSFRLRSR